MSLNKFGISPGLPVICVTWGLLDEAIPIVFAGNKEAVVVLDEDKVAAVLVNGRIVGLVIVVEITTALTSFSRQNKKCMALSS